MLLGLTCGCPFGAHSARRPVPTALAGPSTSSSSVQALPDPPPSAARPLHAKRVADMSLPVVPSFDFSPYTLLGMPPALPGGGCTPRAPWRGLPFVADAVPLAGLRQDGNYGRSVAGRVGPTLGLLCLCAAGLLVVVVW